MALNVQSIMKPFTSAFVLLSVLLAQMHFGAADDVDVARQQRLSVIVGSTTGATSIANW